MRKRRSFGVCLDEEAHHRNINNYHFKQHFHGVGRLPVTAVTAVMAGAREGSYRRQCNTFLSSRN